MAGPNNDLGFIAANLVDEHWLKVNPTIGGRGGSMFTDGGERRTLAARR